MSRCNLEATDKCYGCPYWGMGDTEGCKLTIEFHKNNPDGTREEYAKFMELNGRKKYKYDIQN